jgi:hypothetical protein
MPTPRTIFSHSLAIAVAVALAVILIVLATAAAEAQVVRGVVTRTVDARPVHGALIRLISADSQHVAMLLTDREGRFVLVAPRQGSYVLQAEHVRYTTTRTTPFTVPAAGTITMNVTIPPREDAHHARPKAEPLPVQRTGLMRAERAPLGAKRPALRAQRASLRGRRPSPGRPPQARDTTD